MVLIFLFKIDCMKIESFNSMLQILNCMKTLLEKKGTLVQIFCKQKKALTTQVDNKLILILPGLLGLSGSLKIIILLPRTSEVALPNTQPLLSELWYSFMQTFTNKSHSLKSHLSKSSLCQSQQSPVEYSPAAFLISNIWTSKNPPNLFVSSPLSCVVSVCCIYIYIYILNL